MALKKLTTPNVRALAFSIQYATFNLAGALADALIDYLRAQPDVEILGTRFTGLRRCARTWPWTGVGVCIDICAGGRGPTLRSWPLTSQRPAHVSAEAVGATLFFFLVRGGSH